VIESKQCHVVMLKRVNIHGKLFDELRTIEYIA